jgi:hypothetical protein
MPADFTVEAKYPEGALEPADVRQNFRNIMGGRIRRVMGDMTERAAQETKSQRVAEGYAVVQVSEGEDIAFAIVNNEQIFPFVEEDTVAHWAPWGEGTELAQWSEEHDIDPFLVARKIAREGTKGEHVLQRVWDQGADALAETIQEGCDSWLESYGTATG